MTIPVFELVDRAAELAGVSRSVIVEQGAIERAQHVLDRAARILAKHTRTVRRVARHAARRTKPS